MSEIRPAWEVKQSTNEIEKEFCDKEKIQRMNEQRRELMLISINEILLRSMNSNLGVVIKN